MVCRLPVYAETCRLLLKVGHAVNEINEIWQIDRRALLSCCTPGPRLVNFGPEFPWGAKILKGVKTL